MLIFIFWAWNNLNLIPLAYPKISRLHSLIQFHQMPLQRRILLLFDLKCWKILIRRRLPKRCIKLQLSTRWHNFWPAVKLRYINLWKLVQVVLILHNTPLKVTGTRNVIGRLDYYVFSTTRLKLLNICFRSQMLLVSFNQL